MGVAWHYQGDMEKAEECYKKSIELKPNHINALKNLGQVLIEKKLYANAVVLFEAVLELDPHNNEALGFLASANQHLCRWNDIHAQHERINRLVEAGVDAFIPPFIYLSMTNSPEAQLRCSQAWSRRKMAPVERIACPGEPAPHKNAGEKIRVAYWSNQLQEHATSHLIADMIECHDKEHFEIILISYGKDDGGAKRRRLIAAADDFVDVREHSFEEVAHLIRERGIDILVDINGYTTGTRSPMLALHAAPVQVNWLGYPGTLGTPHAGYIIADNFVIPPGMEHYYSEKVIRLPACYQPNDRKRAIDEPMSRQSYGLPENGFVFCSFNQSYKILPRMFDCWMNILLRVPDSVLWLLSGGTETDVNLRKEAQRRGVAPERLVFAENRPLPQHLARYRIANLALDTFPYGSHTTSSDALWAGCPLVALAGNTFASRVSGSLLTAAGLPELITHDMKSFEELAVRLAQEPQTLQSLKQRLTDTRETMPLFDTPLYTRALESAYRQMINTPSEATNY